MTMTKGKRFLFIGDSITEWGRFEDPENLGDNYVRLIHDYLTVTYPTKRYEIINKGIGGNRVTDLAKRWDEHVIQQNPDVVSISIGINDVWRQIDQTTVDQVYPDQFKEIYDDLITQVKEKTKATIILMEPTVIEEVVSPDGNAMLVPYVEAVQELAKKHDTMIVHTHQLFLDYLEKGSYPLTTDGVHMSPAGNMLMAKGWLQVAKPLYDA